MRCIIAVTLPKTTACMRAECGIIKWRIRVKREKVREGRDRDRLPTANQHHYNGENLLGRCICRHIAKSHRSEAGECEIQRGRVSFSRCQYRNGGVLSFGEQLQPTCEQDLKILDGTKKRRERKDTK